MTKETKKLGPLHEFGQRLRDSRKVAGVGQDDLAHAVGYKSGVSISNIERGHAPCDIGTLLKIADVLSLPDLHWLITGEHSPGETNLKARYADLVLRHTRQVSQHRASIIHTTQVLAVAVNRISTGHPDDAIAALESDMEAWDEVLGDLAKEDALTQHAIAEFKSFGHLMREADKAVAERMERDNS